MKGDKSHKEERKFRRICEDCDSWFLPHGKKQKLCDICRDRRYHWGRRKGKYVQIVSPERYHHLIETTDI